MNESGNVENKGLIPEKEERLTEEAVIRAMANNTTPVLDSIDREERKEILNRFSINNDDRLPEDMGNHILFGDGYEGRMTAKRNTAKAEGILQAKEIQINKQKEDLQGMMEESYLKANGEANLERALERLTTEIEKRKDHFKILLVMHPEKSKAVENASRELQSLQEEIDHIEKRIAPGNKQKALQDYNDLVEKYHRLGQLLSTENAKLN